MRLPHDDAILFDFPTEGRTRLEGIATYLGSIAFYFRSMQTEGRTRLEGIATLRASLSSLSHGATEGRTRLEGIATVTFDWKVIG